jgi:hypothetical protein
MQVPEELIPISMFIGLTVVLCLFFWFRYRMRNDMQATIRTAIDKGQELSPEIIDRLGTPKPPKDRDMRLSLLWLAFALGMVVFGFMLPDDDNEVQQVFMGIAAFPFFIGLAYLLMWRFGGDRS